LFAYWFFNDPTLSTRTTSYSFTQVHIHDRTKTWDIGHRETESRRRQWKREKGQFATHAAIIDTACFLHSKQVNNSFVWSIRRKHNNCIIVLDLTLCIRKRVRMHFSRRQYHRQKGRNFLFFGSHNTFYCTDIFMKTQGWKREGITTFWNSLDAQTMSIDRPRIRLQQNSKWNKQKQKYEQSEGKAQCLFSFYGGFTP